MKPVKPWNQQPPFLLQTKQELQLDPSSDSLIEYSFHSPSPELYYQASLFLERFLEYYPNAAKHPLQFKGIKLSALVLSLHCGKLLKTEEAKDLTRAFHLREFEVRGFRSAKLTSINKLTENYHNNPNPILRPMIDTLQDQYVQEMTPYRLSNLTPDRLICMQKQFLRTLSKNKTQNS